MSVVIRLHQSKGGFRVRPERLKLQALSAAFPPLSQAPSLAFSVHRSVRQRHSWPMRHDPPFAQAPPVLSPKFHALPMPRSFSLRTAAASAPDRQFLHPSGHTSFLRRRVLHLHPVSDKAAPLSAGESHRQRCRPQQCGCQGWSSRGNHRGALPRFFPQHIH